VICGFCRFPVPTADHQGGIDATPKRTGTVKERSRLSRTKARHPASTPAPAPVIRYRAQHGKSSPACRKTHRPPLTEAKQTIPHIYLTVDNPARQLLSCSRRLNASLERAVIKLFVMIC